MSLGLKGLRGFEAVCPLGTRGLPAYYYPQMQILHVHCNTTHAPEAHLFV